MYWLLFCSFSPILLLIDLTHITDLLTLLPIEQWARHICICTLCTSLSRKVKTKQNAVTDFKGVYQHCPPNSNFPHKQQLAIIFVWLLESIEPTQIYVCVCHFGTARPLATHTYAYAYMCNCFVHIGMKMWNIR